MDNDRTGAGRAGGTRVTQREAAERLGISVEAVRKRVKRGTLRSDKGEDGRRYVYLDIDPDAGGPQPEPGTLTSELRDRLRYVEGQLEAERQAHAEARRIIAGLVERMPQLEAPTGGPVGPEPGEGEGDRSNLPREPQHVDEAADTGEGMDSDKDRFATWLEFFCSLRSCADPPIHRALGHHHCSGGGFFVGHYLVNRDCVLNPYLIRVLFDYWRPGSPDSWLDYHSGWRHNGNLLRGQMG